MHNQGEEGLRNEIIGNIPKAFFHDIITGLHLAHKEACQTVENKYSHSVARDVLPHIRRANFESIMPTTAWRYNFNARSVLNSSKNASHVEIETQLGDTKLVLTALFAPNRFDLTKVKSAQFRKTLAEIQPYLFQEYNCGGDGYYGLILYGARAENKEKLDFAYLAFPSSGCNGWFGRYDLFELAGLTATKEVIEDKAAPTLKKNIIRKEM